MSPLRKVGTGAFASAALRFTLLLATAATLALAACGGTDGPDGGRAQVREPRGVPARVICDPAGPRRPRQVYRAVRRRLRAMRRVGALRCGERIGLRARLRFSGRDGGWYLVDVPARNVGGWAELDPEFNRRARATLKRQFRQTDPPTLLVRPKDKRIESPERPGRVFLPRAPSHADVIPRVAVECRAPCKPVPTLPVRVPAPTADRRKRPDLTVSFRPAAAGKLGCTNDVVVTGSGPLPATFSVLTLTVAAGPRHRVTFLSDLPLGPRFRRAVPTVEWELGSTIGSATATIDPADRVRERNERNNTASFGARPDLVCAKAG